MGISIVIPLYNKEKYIVRTIQNILGQTYQEFEIIIVNDGSTDESKEQVLSVTDERVVLVEQKNMGASVARNNGVEKATYEHVAFMDADDIWNDDYLEKMDELIKLYPNAVAYGANYWIEENEKSIVLTYPEISKSVGIIENYFVSGRVYTPLWTSAVVVKKKKFMELGGFPKECKVCEDVDLWCRLALEGEIAYINEPLAVYNRNEEGTLSKLVDNKGCYFPFLDEYERYIKQGETRTSDVIRYVEYRKLVAASYMLFNVKKKKEVLQILKKVKYPTMFARKYWALLFAAYCPQVLLDIYSQYLAKIIHRIR